MAKDAVVGTKVIDVAALAVDANDAEGSMPLIADAGILPLRIN